MNYKTSKIITSSDKKNRTNSVLMIYTGGTLGMVYDTKSKSLVPFDFDQILVNVPELQRLSFELTTLTLPKPIDSSNIKPATWIELAAIIKNNFEQYDAFVILHGTDTMAYTASALSFLLENLSKPVILTGAQLPIGVARTDARENLITALEIASAEINGRPVVPEVAIYFNSYLLRGNRAKKKESSQFNAFRSENYPALAEVGVTIDFNFPFIMPFRPDLPLITHEKLDENVMILKLFPGINQTLVHNILNTNGLRGVVLETYGAGNAPSDEWFLAELHEATKDGIVIFNVSQCDGGRVLQGHYQTSSKLKSIGITSGSDITTEAAITKMMLLLGQESEPERVKYRMENNICGEMS
ncbi:L-asparaginase 1 [Emticicia aquatica]|uniref:asparaginase n=1 Tax=Emticicia aquatica TaxID=1681835 RepID=A0ABN8ETT9_9BACT|nr:asparaginase [Emticicia aquatica]CAH0995198.1 L-asparaginase 1 [Emticicia aquatica]